jgi:hypothetical protein
MNLRGRRVSRLFGILVVGLSLLAGADVHAATKNKGKVVPLTKKGAAAELPTVKKVGDGMITVGDKRYKVADLAEITVNGKPAQLEDIKPGMQAAVTGGVEDYGQTKSDTLYKATKISACTDNKLEQKRKEDNRKQAEKARQANRRLNRNRR